MTFKVIQGHWKWHELIGHMIIFLLVVYINNASISRHFFILPVLRCTWLPVGGLTLKRRSFFGKQLRLKIIDTFSSMYTHSEVDTCHVYWWIEVRKVQKQLKWHSRSLKVIDISAVRYNMQDILFVFHCNYTIRDAILTCARKPT